MRRPLAIVAVLIVTGCTTVQAPPTKAEYRAAISDTARPMVERQRLWQKAKKHYPNGWGE
jgi:hypothetical protein